MQPALAWLLLGLVLVVVELLTGTFYLLILGLAAGVGSLVAWLGRPVLDAGAARFGRRGRRQHHGQAAQVRCRRVHR